MSDRAFRVVENIHPAPAITVMPVAPRIKTLVSPRATPLAIPGLLRRGVRGRCVLTCNEAVVANVMKRVTRAQG